MTSIPENNSRFFGVFSLSHSRCPHILIQLERQRSTTTIPIRQGAALEIFSENFPRYMLTNRYRRAHEASKAASHCFPA